MSWLRRSDARYEPVKSPRKMEAAYGLAFTNPDGTPNGNAEWIYKPDMSAVEGEIHKYWVTPVVADTPALMSQSEQDAVDAAELSASRDALANEIDRNESYTRAFALVVLDEINALRAAASLNPRTPAQLKTALRNKMDI